MFFTQKSDFQAFNRRWKELARARKLTVFDVILRARLLGQDLDDVLPLPTSPNKLANGNWHDSARHIAVPAFERGVFYYRGTRFFTLDEWVSRWANPTEPDAAPYGLTLAQLKEV